MKELEERIPDKIEITKQQIQETQHVLEGRMRPNKNHTIFEVNLQEETIVKAQFDKLPEVSFTEAMKGNIIAKKEITKKPYCLYIPALNTRNVKKILKRNYNIVLK